jgi:chaperonin GroEL
MAKQIIYSSAARKAMKAGIDAVANAVKVTLGPKGRNVVLVKPYGSPHITNDGVTIAKEIELADKAENAGVQLIKEVASKTVDMAGDGTSTATVLAQAILTEGMRVIEAGANPMEIRSGLNKSVAAVIAEVKKMAIEINGKEDIRRVAYISSNGDDQIADALSEIYEKIGKDGVLTIEDGQTVGTSVKYVDGMVFDKGYISPYFVTDSDTMQAVVENPYILITDTKVSNIKQDLLPIIEKIVQGGSKNIVIIAEDVDGEALATLIVNKLKGILNVVAVKAPAFGDRRKAMLQDIAILTGGTVVTSEVGMKLESTTVENLGRAKKVIVKKDECIIIDGGGEKEAINGRVDTIKKEIENTKSDYDKEKLFERLAKLTGGVAVMQIGAATETALKELKDRAEDAKCAVVAAISEGIVPGGGVALLEAREVLNSLKLEGDEKTAANILYKALEAPAKQIAENAGIDGSVAVLKKTEKGNGFGYDARNDQYVDMVKAGIIDPVKVVRLEVENAESVSAITLTSEAIVVDIPEPKESKAPPAGMGGMDMDY